VRVIPNDGSVYPLISGANGSQLIAVDADHNSVGPDNPTPVIPADGSLDGLVSTDIGTFAPNTVYQLSVDVGLERAFGALDVGIALGSGQPTLADLLPTPGRPAYAFNLINGANLMNDTLVVDTVTLNTADFVDLVGQPINVSLIYHSDFKYGREALFDNIQLITPAPEPGTLSLVAIGGLLILLPKRSRS
jgi:hypothetical protein